MLPAIPAAPPRSFELVARQITALIGERYGVGERIPAERVLAKTFGVSRPTIREAILSLQMAGVLQVRTNSGAYVVGRHAPADAKSPEGFGPFENLQARQMLEPQVAALAAQHATAPQLARLGESLAGMRRDHAEGREADAHDHSFHLILAEATKNGLLVSLCDTLWRGQIESRIWQEIHASMPMEAHRPTWLADHEAILAAVEQRDGRRASAAMTRHLGHIRDALMHASGARARAMKRGGERV